MKRLINIFLCIGFISFLSCDDVFEEDIEEENIQVIFPKEWDTISSNSVEFRWGEIDGAKNYRLFVTSTSTGKVLYDTLALGSHVNLPFNTGRFVWKVRGENSAYTTAYTKEINFQVASSSDLSEQTLFLKSPSDNFYTNTTQSILLTWEFNKNALDYVLEIDKTVSNNTETIIHEEELTSNNYTLDASEIVDDALYTWRVKGVNEESETVYTSRKIYIDKKAPNVPALMTPEDNAISGDTVTFVWEVADDLGVISSPTKSILQLAKNAEFTDGVIEFETSDNEREYIFPDNGDYYWRVKTLDEAGNQSEYSDNKKITIQ